VHTAPVADVPRSIVDHVTEFEPDLIVMCTHGRGGVGRLVYGSVAQQVVGQGSSPLLLVKPEASPPPFELERILLPLDPESGHDEGLPVGRDIALAFQAELFLLSVTHSAATMPGEQAAAGTFMPATAQAFLDIREENTRAHLQEHVNSLRAEGLEAAAGVLRGDAAGAILSAAGALDVDLIILCTHGRAGLSAFWARSVAPTVAQRAGVPILLIPLA
jgi:nucleotide-binding universal stress UspA family protein